MSNSNNMITVQQLHEALMFWQYLYIECYDMLIVELYTIVKMVK